MRRDAALTALWLSLVMLVLLPAVALAGSERAARSSATHISTTTYNTNTTWTTGGSPYILDGNVTVASGVTLTINPGVVVKFNGQLRELIVNGTLSAVGSSGSEIVFTSYKDDTVGGDSNGDGSATSPAAGDWYRVRITAGTSSQLAHVKIRYGGWGSANASYGAVWAEGSSTQVTVGNAEITQNQRSGIYAQTGAGVTVSASTISTNANGISVNQGWVKVKARTFLTGNSADGLYFSLTSTYSGTTSAITDSDVSGNTSRGIYISASGLAAAKYPYGNRNNVYDNGPSQTDGKQLVTTARRWDVDWTGNYWGSDVYFWKAAGVCQGVSDETYGHLSYRWSNPAPGGGGIPTPPDGPIAHANYVAGSGGSTSNCPRDNYRIWQTEYSPSYLGGEQPALPDGQALVCAAIQTWLNSVGRGDLTACKSDPVNSATGNFNHVTQDISLPGVGITFSFIRSYNSLDVHSGTLGLGWTHNQSAWLELKASGDVVFHDIDGQSYAYANDGSSFTPPPGALAMLASSGGSYTLTAANRVTYSFDGNGRLQTLEDGNGEGLTYAYSAGRVSTVTDAAGREVTFTYNGSGNLTQISVPDGRSVSYGYTSGRLTSVTDVRGKVWTYAYEAHGLLEKETDPLSHVVFKNTYGADGRVASQLDALNNETDFDWDYATQTQTQTDPRGKEWKDVYEGNVLVTRIDPFDSETSYGHDASLNRTSETDALGNTWTMTYDAHGNMLTRTAPSPLSYEESWTYSAENDLLSHTDGRGNTASYDYDADGNLTEITQPGSVVTDFTYDASGLVASMTNPRGKTWDFGYDADGNLDSITTPLGHEATAAYDDAGRPTSAVDPRGNETGADPGDFDWTYTYNAAGEPLTATDPLGHETTFAYDDAGRLTSATDARSHTSSYGYDAANRLTTVTAPGSAVTTYAYDAAGNATTRTDANNHETTYTYDDGNRPASVTSPESKTWQYAYDDANRLTEATLPSTATIGSSYDEIGRLTGVDYSDSTPDVSFTYDASSNITEMDDGAGTQTSDFDALNRPTSVTRDSDTFAYAYDDASNITERTLPDSREIDYVYDDDGLLSSLTTGGLTTSYDYDAAGNVTDTTLPSGNGYVDERTYDDAGRLTRVKSVKGASTLADFTYTLDAVGNPTEVVRAGALSSTETFTYDSRDRLTESCLQSSCPGGSDPFIRYTYDGVGNRSTEVRPAGTTSYSYNEDDELTQAGSTSYDYDANGNETEAGSRTFAYDLAGRMTSTTLSGQTTSYAYDGVGNRIEETTGGDEIDSFWDVNASPALLALERDGQGDALRSYTHGLGLVSMLTDSEQHYFHGDLLGSIANVTSANGTKEWTYAYEAYGTPRTTTQDDAGAPANPIRFAGEHRDGSGLSNLRSRLYDSQTGRFTSQQTMPEPLAKPAASAYAYGDESPTGTVSSNGISSSSASDGCGPGITRCSLEKLANSPCPPPLVPYMGLPGFKPYWLDGYYSVCEGQRAAMREQLGLPVNDLLAKSWARCTLLAVGGVTMLGGYGLAIREGIAAVRAGTSIFKAVGFGWAEKVGSAGSVAVVASFATGGCP
jgi:RHS repeat-associated protein